MQRQQIQSYFFVFGVALTLSACFTEPDYPDTPSIEFNGLFRYTIEATKGVGKGKRDSVVLTVKFKDGDGNLGNNIPISKADSARYASNGGWGNYEIRTFRLINKQYVELPAQVNKFLLFPDLTENKPKGAIEGSLDFFQTFPYGSAYQFYPTKFQIRIRDRALNTSNVVESDTINLPFPKER
ncbi:hypothetical protein [Spirosoma areae]